MKSTKLYTWIMRLVSLPLAVLSGNIAINIYYRATNGIMQVGDSLGFAVFIVGGTFCLVIFIASFLRKSEELEVGE